MVIRQDERVFFVELGAHIAQRRKDSQMTQVQLAETRCVSQPTMNSYELGQRRIPVSALLTLARSLGAGLEELRGKSAATKKKRGPAPKRQQQVERLSLLPKAQQRVMMMQVLDGVLAQAGHR